MTVFRIRLTVFFLRAWNTVNSTVPLCFFRHGQNFRLPLTVFPNAGTVFFSRVPKKQSVQLCKNTVKFNENDGLKKNTGTVFLAPDGIFKMLIFSWENAQFFFEILSLTVSCLKWTVSKYCREDQGGRTDGSADGRTHVFSFKLNPSVNPSFHSN